MKQNIVSVFFSEIMNLFFFLYIYIFICYFLCVYEFILQLQNGHRNNLAEKKYSILVS